MYIDLFPSSVNNLEIALGENLKSNNRTDIKTGEIITRRFKLKLKIFIVNAKKKNKNIRARTQIKLLHNLPHKSLIKPK
ncbi:hypothetical protein [Vibrio sp. 1151_11]|uniref:hypothetical protein n=1 Tax=Vibrio sp. 1151_11 TaxID=2527670 RepID=UPI0024074159|nr:hypothetical protein [Vibrio sp. 1151_11]